MTAQSDDSERAAIQGETDAQGDGGDFPPADDAPAATNDAAVPRTTREAPFARADHVELGYRLLARLSPDLDRLVFDDGALHRYDPTAGLWQAVDQSELARIVHTFAGASVNGRGRPLTINIGDINGAITVAHDQRASVGYFAEAPAGLAFTNGFVLVTPDGFELRSHMAEWRARNGYAFAYDPSRSARCPRWIVFLEDLFRDDTDRAERIAFLRQFYGACLLGIAPRYQVSLVLLGDGSNGKSTMVDILQACFPKGSIAAVPPQQWNQDYKLAMLAGKRLNCVPELPEKDILGSQTFKAVITGDVVNARSPYKEPFAFRPPAGHVFAGNKLPGATDASHGFWRRFVVIRLSRMFSDAEKKPNLAAEIIEAERAAIIAWMFDGGRELLSRRAYTIPASSHAELAEWQKSANNVASFCAEKTRPIVADEQGTLATALYSAYRQWCADNGNLAVNSRNFSDRMRLLGWPSVHTRAGYRYPVTLERAAP